MSTLCRFCECEADILCGNNACDCPLCFECALMIGEIYYCPLCFAHRIGSMLLTCVKRVTDAASVLPEDQFRAVIEEVNRQLAHPQAETIPDLSVQSLIDALSNASRAQRQPVAENEEDSEV